jgi:HEAT repeat protein
MSAAECDQLLKILLDRNAKAEERAVAADRLGRAREKAAADAMLEVVQDGAEADILRYKAARALGVLKDKRAVPLLTGLLGSQSADRHLRVVSALALGNLGTEDSFVALRAAASDPDSLIRYKALQALQRTPNSSNRDTVEKALSDLDPYVQASAIHTLGKLGDKATVGTLDEILRSTQSDFIKIACLTALGNIRESESVDLLRRYEGNTNQLLSLNARTALRRLNQTERNQR